MKSARAALSLIEILVSITIVGVLVTLLLPAIQASRETARSNDCRNRMRQCTLATHSFHESHGVVPGPIAPRVGRPAFPRMLSAWAHLLPHLDQASLHSQIDQDRAELGLGAYPGPPVLTRPSNQQLLRTALPVVVCPSDTTPQNGCNFRVCWGTWPGSETGRAPPNTGFPGVWHQSVGLGPARFSMVTDGLSQTVLLSERTVGDFDPSVFTPSRDTYYYDGPVNPPFLETPTDYAEACATRFTNPLRGEMSFGGATWLLAGKAYTIYNHVLGPNSMIPDCTAAGPWMYDSATTARSWHRGGVNVAFADGSTRFVAESIDVYLWRALGTRNGREVVDE